MSEEYVCWRCGAALANIPRPLPRLLKCAACDVELYVCRMCRHYRPRLSRGCELDQAEPPRDKERANFCDLFVMMPNAYQTPDTRAANEARAGLDALFGDAPASPATGKSDTLSELERLFSEPDDDPKSRD